MDCRDHDRSLFIEVIFGIYAGIIHKWSKFRKLLSSQKGPCQFKILSNQKLLKIILHHKIKGNRIFNNI